ncbi:MAG: heavy metal translocating P-type ATPase [Candidatus Cloacimonetes bacterium]|nr:heavy metal translocating P-type ATPase [Candidatus Cloacimonadota bacterium]
MKRFYLKNLDCANCANKIEKSINNLQSVKKASIDFSTLTLLIDTDSMNEVLTEIKKIEPDIILLEQEIETFNPKKELIMMSIVSFIYLFVLIFNNIFTLYHIDKIIFMSIYLLYGWKIFLKAINKLRNGGIFDENFLMTIATLGAITINAFSEAAGVMLFFRIGEYLQDFAVHKSRKSIKALLEIRPDYANLMENNEIKKVAPELVKVNDYIIVKAGERLPLDGVIIKGKSQVDTSVLTGESVPKTVREGDEVFAGMINKSGLITIQVTKVFSESSVARIMELVETATHKKAKTEMFFSRFAGYYTPIVVILALLTAILPPLLFSDQNFSDWLYRALVMLVISCPCALVVSIPLAYFGGIGAASKNGILIKGSCFIDSLNQVRRVVFDKTGTLTKGVFKLTKIESVNDFSKNELLEMVAIADSHSNHPIALSIREAYQKDINMSDIIDYQELSGLGIRAHIKKGDNEYFVLCGNSKLMDKFKIMFNDIDIPDTYIHIAVNDLYAGYIVISDELKSDSIDAVNQLKSIGITEISMLTGDNYNIAKSIADKLKIDKVYADLLPEAKFKILEEIISQSSLDEKLIFVGDGINDAPVLARADIGISMGNIGSDAAIETADIVIMDDSLSKIPKAIKVASTTKNIIIQNIVLALGLKLLFIILGFMGIATMWEAVFGDVGVTLIAVFNAGRMLKKKF